MVSRSDGVVSAIRHGGEMSLEAVFPHISVHAQNFTQINK